MAVPYTFASATSSLPLSQLDSNFNTPITLGNTSIQLGNTVSVLNNMTLANVTVSSLSTALPTTSGGTGLTSFTANAVVYASSTSNLATSSSLVFDSTNTRLGIGTSSPVSGIHIIGGSSSSSRALRIESNSAASTSPPLFILFRSTTTGSASQFVGQITFSRTLTDSTTDTAASFFAYGNNNAGSSTGILRSDAITRVEFYISGAEKFVVEGNYVRQTVITVATLPSAATAGVGSRAFVSDANSTTFASIVAGGGSNNVPVYSDGTNWRIG